MTWETFYDRFYDWADSTQISNVSKLKSFGPSSEVCEIALAFIDEKVATRLVKKALAAGMRFTAEEVVELDCCVNESLIPELAKTASTAFTADELDTISLSLNEQDLKAIARKSGLKLDEDNFVITDSNEMDEQIDQILEDLTVIEAFIDANKQEETFNTKKHRKNSFFAFLAAICNAGRSKEDNGHCDGNCASCPPHYGYRYGRWYYGHGHRYGCQRGGNGGASGKCHRD